MYMGREKERETRGGGGGTYSRIQRRVGVTLFRESADRIALIARRVKLPRSPLIERSARVPAYVGTENRAYVYSRQVFAARSASSRATRRVRLTHVKERIIDTLLAQITAFSREIASCATMLLLTTLCIRSGSIAPCFS